MEMRPASTNGSAAPAAKGMTVRGTSAMETALFAVSYTAPLYVLISWTLVAPLEAPVVAAVGGVGCGSRRGVIDTTPDDLRKRRENVSCSAGLEGGSRDRLENRLAPLDAESRHDGGSEGALCRRGECLAHEGGAERGGHFAGMGVGVWGCMGGEGGEWS